MPLLRQARSEGKIAYFPHTRLIVKERPSISSGVGAAAGNRVDSWSLRQRSAFGGDSVMGAGAGTSVGAAVDTGAPVPLATDAGGTATSAIRGAAAGGMERDADTAVSEAGSKSQPQIRKQRARK